MQEKVEIEGKSFEIKPLYQLNINENGQYSTEYYIIDNQILVAISSGTPSVSDIENGSKILNQIINDYRQDQYYFIWDITGLKKLPVKVRKKIIEEKNILDSNWKSQYLVVNGTMKMLFKLYMIVFPEKISNAYATTSVQSALHLILQKGKYPSPKKIKYHSPFNSTMDQLKKLSKEDLIKKVLEIEKMHNERTLQIFNTIGKISWDASFQPMPIDIDENDPYFDLINVINLIQNDVQDIISDLVDLNQNLEMKVAERIVDIIDKESNLRSILDNSDSETWLINSRYELIDFNHKFYKSFIKKNSSSPEINKNILNLIDDENERDKWKIRYDAALKGRAGIYIDEVNDEGQLKILEIKTFPINEIGKIKGVSIFIKDITDLKKSELKLIQKNRDLEKVNSELDSFVYRVSHDLRAPLTSILGLINLLKIESDPEKQKYYMNLQEKSVKKLDNFIQDIINLSRNSRQELSIEKIDFEELVKYIMEGQHFSEYSDIIEKRIQINSNGDFFTDRKRLGIILNNLISNGIKYCNPRNENPFIEIKVDSSEDKSVINIRDNGTGIADDHINKIFTMFYRAHQDNSGSGLGLYIVKETIDKLYGTITVKSQLRQGSVFTVTLPNLKDINNKA